MKYKTYLLLNYSKIKITIPNKNHQLPTISTYKKPKTTLSYGIWYTYGIRCTIKQYLLHKTTSNSSKFNIHHETDRTHRTQITRLRKTIRHRASACETVARAPPRLIGY